MSSEGCWRGSESPTSMTANLSEKPLGMKSSSRTNSFTGLLALEDSFLNLAVTLDQYAVSSSRCIISRKSTVVSIIGTAFTTELACLKQANTIFEVHFEPSLVLLTPYLLKNWKCRIKKFYSFAQFFFQAAISLRRIRDILDKIKSADRLKFCKSDFECAVSYLRRQKFMMADDLMLEIRSVSDDYFNQVSTSQTQITCCLRGSSLSFSSQVFITLLLHIFPQTFFHKLPADVVKEIFVWLPIDDFSPIPTVCKDWKVLAGSDEVWQTFYRYKFLRHNPDTMPLERGNYQQAFRNRLADPELGDKVEVAWRGKFRLEALDVYQGLAWWVAEIVDKHTSQGKYKIRYPGWESRWVKIMYVIDFLSHPPPTS